MTEGVRSQLPSSSSVDRRLIFAIFALIPIATIGATAGTLRLGGWIWFIILIAGGATLMLGPLPRPALVFLIPYAAYLVYGLVSLLWASRIRWGLQSLAQLSTFAVSYLLAFRVFRRGHATLPELHRLGLYVLPAIFVVAAIKLALDPQIRVFWSLGPNDRFVAIALVAVFVVGTAVSPRRVVLLAGAACLGLIAISGGRMAFAALALVIVLSPGLGMKRSARLALFGVGALLVLLAIPTQAFQDRFFFAAGGDVSTLAEGSFNTAGRSDNWPAVVADCGRVALRGYGSGGSADVMDRITAGNTIHPHNDYLRTYCEAGLPMAVTFWLFFVGVGYRAWRLKRARIQSTAPSTALLLLLGLFMLSITDNIIIYTAIYMAPAAVIFAASDVEYLRAISPVHR